MSAFAPEETITTLPQCSTIKHIRRHILAPGKQNSQVGKIFSSIPPPLGKTVII